LCTASNCKIKIPVDFIKKEEYKNYTYRFASFGVPRIFAGRPR
jgi:hypothetical protein